MHRSALILAVHREVGAAVSEEGALSEFLATIAIEDIQWDARREDPYPRNVPAANDFVRPVACREPATPKGKVVGC